MIAVAGPAAIDSQRASQNCARSRAAVALVRRRPPVSGSSRSSDVGQG